MRRSLLPALALAGSVLVSLAAPAAAAPQFLRRPDVHGDAVVFTSEGDLWLGSLTTLKAMRLTSDEGYEGPARFSPDGRRIAFTAQYDGGTDVYVMDADGGVPTRLTWDPAGARVQGWSPDGRWILFRSRRAEGIPRNRFWAVPAAGGPARLLPIPYGEFASVAGDGHRIAYVPVSAEWQNWKRYRGGEADDVWLADTLAHSFRRLTDDPGIDTEPLWAGAQIVFVSERDGHANLWRLDPAGGAPAELTHYTDYDVRYPGSDGRTVVFEHGDGLAMLDLATGASRELPFDLHSERIHARVRRVSALENLFDVALGPTGKRLLVSARGQILSVPAEHGDVRVVASDPGSRDQYPAWSPDGRRVAFVSDRSGEEQIWIATANGDSARQLTRDHTGPLGPLAWSPDGRTISTSDREMRLLLADAGSGRLTTVDQADRGGSYDLIDNSGCFSPDGKWFAYAKPEPNWNFAVWLYDVANHKAVRVSDPEMSSYAPAFDPGGAFLVFLSDRAFDPRSLNANRYFTYDKFTRVSLVPLASDGASPFLEKSDEETGAEAGGKDKGAGKPGTGGDSASTKKATRVDVAGLAQRIVDVPVPADHYDSVTPVEGRLLLGVVLDPADAGPDSPRELRAFDLKKQEVKSLAKSITDYQVSGDSRKLLVRKHDEFTIADASVDAIPDDKGKVPTDDWTLTLDPAAEWRQMFEETWRIARDFFYDPAMHGVDWPAVRRKYEALLPAMADRSDLSFLQQQVVAELNCGHAYIVGGDVSHGRTIPMGLLGADVALEPGPTPAYRIVHLLAGDGFDYSARSPLLAPGLDVHEGTFILAVDSRPVRADQDLQALLVGTANRETRLTVNDRPTAAGAREIRIKPMANERWARYFDWVAGRAAYVREHGGANLAYLHIPDMSEAGLREFGKHYYPNLNHDGLIVDVRFNGGGYIDAMLLLQLSSPVYSYFKPRYGASWTRQDWGFAGRKVALCNEESGSDAEEFSDAFQRLKLGPVIGARTWGGEVGSGGGYPLLDGGTVFIPNYGEWVPSGQWVIEGSGFKPDIEVPEDPALLAQGRDPQLDRAIEYLQSSLKQEPLARPAPPAFPDKALRN